MEYNENMNKLKVGTILKEIRLRRHSSQSDSAEGIGISQSLLAQYETGKIRKVNKRTLIKMLDYYEISPKYFEALLINI